MIDLMSDRCRRICGSTDRACYINSREQLNCIADMVVNKTATISMIMRFSLQEDERSFIDENIREVIANAYELSNWVRYLQLVQDLRRLSSLVLDADSKEKRKDIRYPVPDEHVDTMLAMVHCGEGATGMEGRLVNFSQSGLRLRMKGMPCSGPATIRIIPRSAEGRALELSVDVRYAGVDSEGYALGAKVLNVGGNAVFNFFDEVYRIILEARAGLT